MSNHEVNIDEVRTLHWHIGVMCTHDVAALVYLQELGEALGPERLAAYPLTVSRLEEKTEEALRKFAEAYPGGTRETVVKTFQIWGRSKEHFERLQEYVHPYLFHRQLTL